MVGVLLRLAKILLILLLLPPLLWLGIILFNVHLPLTILKQPLSAAATYTLGREITLAGDITVAPTLVPTLEVTEVTIGNPKGKQGQLLYLQRVYLEIALIPLLKRNLVIEEFLAQNVRLNLQAYEDGTGNWQLSLPAEIAADDSEDSALNLNAVTEWKMSVDVQSLRFEDISISYSDPARGSNLVFQLDQLAGRARWKQDIALQGSGSYQQQPWQLSITGDGLRDLLRGRPGWRLQTAADLSGMHFRWQLELLPGNLKTGVSISGQNLTTLSPVAGVALPHWGPYELAGTLMTEADAYFLQDLQLKVGASEMVGSLQLRAKDSTPHLSIDLSSNRLQLNDFELAAADNSLPSPPASDAAGPPPQAEPEDPVDIEALLSPDVLGAFRLQLNLEFAEVLSGADPLGSGRLQASVGGDRVTLEELHVNVTGGDIAINGEIVAAPGGYEIDLQLDVDNFDYGVLARRVDPATDLEGQFFLKVNLQSSTVHLQDTMNHANGGLDFAVWPQEFRSGVIDLWAVGLISAALNQFESESVVNCLVARFDIKDGIMSERALMIDTSEIRVLGDAIIDFPNQQIDLIMAPRSKKAQLVSAATPVQLIGSFDDFEPKIESSDIAFSALRSGFNIALLGIPMVFHKAQAADGSEDCRRAMTEDVRLGRRNPG